MIKLAPPDAGKTAWNYTTLYTFDYGSYPYPVLDVVGGVTVDATGALYGVTQWGGLNQTGGQLGSGTVYKLAPNSTKFTFSILHKFNGLNGGNPAIAPILDPKGNLIGTTPEGGYGFGPGEQVGTGAIYALSPNAQGPWPEKVLSRFQNPYRGEVPAGRLLRDASGNVFGVTQSGGLYGAGTVYMLDASASGVRRVLYHFKGTGRIPCKTGRFQDGSLPLVGLIADAAGILYGTTGNGGSSNKGVVYMLRKTGSNTWKETILHNFAGYPKDGAGPNSELTLVMGVLYGTTYVGGTQNPQSGTIFSLTPPAKGKTAWSYKVVHNFKAAAEGTPLAAPLVSDAKGNIYGLTAGPRGTTGLCGEFFKLTP